MSTELKKTIDQIQESFDRLFPEHKGHRLEKTVTITELSAPFICSCGETLRLTIRMSMREEARPFYEYLMACQQKRIEEFNAVNNAAAKIGYMLVKGDVLARLIERANLKEGELI